MQSDGYHMVEMAVGGKTIGQTVDVASVTHFQRSLARWQAGCRSLGHLVGIEVQKSASPTAHDFKGLRFLAEQTGRKFIRGILLYTGTESVAFGSNLHAVPISALWAMA